MKGLDLWVVPLESTRTPCADPAFELWLLTAIDRELIGVEGQPGDARLVLLYAMCRDHGVALAGPPPRRVFGPIRRSWLVDAMRVDLALAGAAGWYRVLNACRTLHYLDRGSMCGKLTGAAWARTRVPDASLIDAAVAWRRLGTGPPLPPEDVDVFVGAIAGRLDGDAPAVVEIAPRHVVADHTRLVTCVLVAPRDAELLVLAAKRFAEQDWPERELLVLWPHGATAEAALPGDGDERVRTVAIAPEDAGVWRELAPRHARGAVLAAWDAATWYSRDRLTQQMLELDSTAAPRLVAPSLLVYDPSAKAARRLRDPELLERSTLFARRAEWAARAAPRRGSASAPTSPWWSTRARPSSARRRRSTRPAGSWARSSTSTRSPFRGRRRPAGGGRPSRASCRPTTGAASRSGRSGSSSSRTTPTASW